MTEYVYVGSSAERVILGPMSAPSYWQGDDGIVYNIASMTESELRNINWLPVEYTNSISMYETLSAVNVSIGASSVSITYETSYVSLEEIKDIRTRQVNAKRDENLDGGFTYGGYNFDSDEDAKRNIQGVVSSYDILALQSVSADPVDWTLADNTIITIQPEDMISIGLAFTNYTSSIYMTARLIKNNILNCTTEASAINYDIDQGWPSSDLGGTIS